MENNLAERRGLVQQVLKAREDARLRRESNDLTRPEALARDHHCRDKSSAREAICRIEFGNRIWSAIYPFWSEQPNPRLPRAHTRAEAIESQEMVSTFETVFCNLAGYRNSYTNYQASRPELSETSPVIDQLLHRQPRWMPGPTRTNWDNPSICDVPESRRTILDTGSFIPYMGSTDMNHLPHPRDPCIEPLIGEEDLPWIPPFNPVFPESPQVNVSANKTSLDISSPAEEAYAQQQCPAPTSVQSTPPRMRRCKDPIKTSETRLNRTQQTSRTSLHVALLAWLATGLCIHKKRRTPPRARMTLLLVGRDVVDDTNAVLRTYPTQLIFHTCLTP